jgi:acyl-coenzyme A thioesterase PaaI-like protein
VGRVTAVADVVSVTRPPADAVMPARADRAPAPGSLVPSHYTRCFGCGEDSPQGLHVRVTAGEGMGVTATFEVTEHHQGAPGLAHGGLLSAAFDETLGALNWLLGKPAVTARLEVDFRRPVPVGSVLHIEAEVLGVAGRKVYSRAVGRLGSPEGKVAVEASALFLSVGLEHYVTNARPEDLARAATDRQVRGSLEQLEINP